MICSFSFKILKNVSVCIKRLKPHLLPVFSFGSILLFLLDIPHVLNVIQDRDLLVFIMMGTGVQVFIRWFQQKNL